MKEKTFGEAFPDLAKRMMKTTVGELEEMGYAVSVSDKEQAELTSKIVSDLQLAPAREPIANVVVNGFLRGIQSIVLANDVFQRAREDGDEIDYSPLVTPRKR